MIYKQASISQPRFLHFVIFHDKYTKKFTKANSRVKRHPLITLSLLLLYFLIHNLSEHIKASSERRNNSIKGVFKKTM